MKAWEKFVKKEMEEKEENQFLKEIFNAKLDAEKYEKTLHEKFRYSKQINKRKKRLYYIISVMLILLFGLFFTLNYLGNQNSRNIDQIAINYITENKIEFFDIKRGEQSEINIQAVKFYKDGRYQRALELWQDSVVKDSDEYFYYLLSLIYNGEYDKTIPLLEDFLENKNPDDSFYSEANLHLWITYKLNKEKDKAYSLQNLWDKNSWEYKESLKITQ